MSLACLEVELLLEVLLDLLQPIQAVLSLQVNLRPLEIVSNDSPYTKTWVKKNMSLACLEVKLLLDWLVNSYKVVMSIVLPHLGTASPNVLGPLVMKPCCKYVLQIKINFRTTRPS